jgi:hypothetical protein
MLFYQFVDPTKNRPSVSRGSLAELSRDLGAVRNVDYFDYSNFITAQDL